MARQTGNKAQYTQAVLYYSFSFLAYIALILTLKSWQLPSFAYHVLILLPLIIFAVPKSQFDIKKANPAKALSYGALAFFAFYVFSAFEIVPVKVSQIVFPEIFQFVSIALFSPLAEEIFFRVYLQQSFAGLFKKNVSTIFLVSFLFSIVHIPKLIILDFPLAGFLILDFIVSAVISLEYSKTGNFFDAFITHFTYNLIVISTVA